MKFDSNEKNRLCRCINERIETLREETTLFNYLKGTASEGEFEPKGADVIKSCDNLIKLHQQEYSDLIKLKEKICKDEDEEND